MAAKHSVRVFGTARFILSFGVAVLVLLVVWIAVRAVGPAEANNGMTMVVPPVSLTPEPTISRTTVVPPSISPSPSLSPSPTRTSARPRATTPSRSSSPSPRKTTTPPTVTDVEAALRVTASWDSGYVAAVRVVNEGDRPIDWRVTVSHSGLANLQLRGVWNARGDQQGSSFVFNGGTLAPGAEAMFGFQTSKSGRGNARPAGCNALGGSCRVR
ncbi:cellulose binding domain-containing protein [Actinoplanes sp. LDG1-06]|uniref:Cellulose binding domain-containing protein n=1 Tax=Paractinoplanes ovalisporus TaxID=2810368 RepID=A0ABS2AGG8_9ACTN|nr:cellulose binding domain-containing protein [Actinoplanes ovalisporus]MBM2618943.1 cellulose binding domain-containing protein [Actinoplanes ovalisporus]